MTLFRSTLFLSPVVCLLAQTPTPKPASPAAPKVTLSEEKPAASTAPSVPPDKVVLAVGSMKLTAQQYDLIIDSLPEQYRGAARGAGRRDFAQNLVRIMVLADEGKRRKVDQSPAFKTQQEFQDMNLLAGKTFNEIGNDTKVSDADLKAMYDAHKSEFEQVRARHILIRMSGSPLPLKPGQKDLSDAEALAKAQDLRKQIMAGADFAALASKESDDTGSATQGGDLNFFHKGQMVAPFEQAAFALKVGEVSEPVKSQFGYHVIKVEAHEAKSFEDSKADLEKRVRPEMAQKAIEDLTKKAMVIMDPEFFGPPPAK